VASALDAAHAAGLVHRDVKPANILVDTRPDRPDHVYLSDFGVSKGAAASVGLTGAGQFLGTPDYSAPEQIRGRAVDGRTDQYALACVAYQLLTGSVPFERDQGMAVLLAHLFEPPPSLSSRRPGLPGAADEVLARGMAKVLEKRYRSCRAFADALREALGLAPYYPAGTGSTADRPQTQIVSPPPKLPGPAAASLAADAVPLITVTAPSPAYSTAGKADARQDAGLTAPPGGGEQRAAPPSHDDHRRAVTAGPGPGGKTSRASRRGRAIQRRLVIITTAIGIVVIGLVIAITAISGTPPSSAGRPRSLGTPNGPARSHASGRPDGSARSQASGTPGRLRWTDYYNAPSPAVTGRTVYVGSGGTNGSNEVYALDAATGKIRWTYSTIAGDVVYSPAVAGGIVYVGSGGNSGDGEVYALDAATGKIRWTYRTIGNSVYSGPAVAGSTVYVGTVSSVGGAVYALNAATGQVRWTHIIAGAISWSPAVAGGTVYVTAWVGGGSGYSEVYGLDAATGLAELAAGLIFVFAEARPRSAPAGHVNKPGPRSDTLRLQQAVQRHRQTGDSASKYAGASPSPARDHPPPPCPLGEVAVGGQGVRVLGAQHPLVDGQQRGLLVAGPACIPRHPGPAGEAGAGGQGVRVLGA
jgi:hypothetical protein